MSLAGPKMCPKSLEICCFILLVQIPCFVHLMDVNRLKIHSIKSRWNTPVQPFKFEHNETACVFRFHDFPFLGMKKVTLTNDRHFKGRKDCAVEFFNLPKGLIFAKIQDQELLEDFVTFTQQEKWVVWKRSICQERVFTIDCKKIVLSNVGYRPIRFALFTVRFYYSASRESRTQKDLWG